jgi:predicted HTH transcriptional regulator
MMTTPEQIDLWRKLPSETQRLEFKEAKAQFDQRKLCEYCVALANEGGGHLLLGIRDQMPRQVVGTAAFSDPIAMMEKLFNAVGFRVDIEEVAHPDGRVLVFHIPSRPRGTAYHFDGRYLMRAGEALVSMSEDRLRGIFGEGRPDWLEEASKSSLGAQDVVDLLDTQTYFELLGRPYPSTRDAVIEHLANDKLIDREGAGYSIRRIGALLLAKRLDRFDDLSRKAPRVVVYQGSTKDRTRLDQTGTMGYAVGFRRLIEFVMNQLPQNEVIERALRSETKLVPEIAVRELVANALVHQDLSLAGMSVMIEIYADRIEISNPGEPIVPVDRFIDGHQSRNERLALLMRRLNICEEKSSGIDNVVIAAEAFQLAVPDFRVGLRRTISVIAGPRSFDRMDRNDRIRACYQHCALRLVSNAPAMTNQSLRERFQLPEDKSSTVSLVISATAEAGLIKTDERAGASKKFAKYLPFWA